MRKRILTIAVIVLAVSGLVLADNTATVNQSGGGSNSASVTQANGATATITQVGSTLNSATTNQNGTSPANNVLTIQQIGQAPGGAAATNQAIATQTGNGNLANVKQIAAAGQSNAIVTAGPTAGIVQNGSGNQLVHALGDAWSVPATVDSANPALQDSLNGSNSLRANMQGDNNKIGLYQMANGNNSADIDQLNGDNELAVYQGRKQRPDRSTSNTLLADQSGNDVARLAQGSGGSNSATVNQQGGSNLLGGAGTTGVTTGTATQYASSGGTTLILDQSGNDQAGIYQRSDPGPAYAEIHQAGGNNVLAVRQDTDYIGSGYVLANQSGGNNIALLDQDPKSGNAATANIDQAGGNNVLRRANTDGSIDATNRAEQHAGSGSGKYVTLDLDQTGGGNKAGLYQSGTGYALADIDQSGGLNTLGAYQSTSAGYNELWVTQTGGDTATVIQTGAVNNYANISQ